MTNFVFSELIPVSENVQSGQLGTTTAQYSANDVGRAVTLGTASNFKEVTTAGEEIDGFIIAVEPFTVNNGYSFGSVMREGRKWCQYEANTVTTALIGRRVKASTTASQPAVVAPTVGMTANANNGSGILPMVGVVADTTVLLRDPWTIIAIDTSNASQHKVLIERL